MIYVNLYEKNITEDFLFLKKNLNTWKQCFILSITFFKRIQSISNLSYHPFMNLKVGGLLP